MIKRRTYRITDWLKWNDEIDEAITDFESATGLWPNLLLANEFTLNSIDIYADRKSMVDDEGNNPKDGLISGSLSVFRTKKYNGDKFEVKFCYGFKLPDNTFMLIYDPHPDIIDVEPVALPVGCSGVNLDDKLSKY